MKNTKRMGAVAIVVMGVVTGAAADRADWMTIAAGGPPQSVVGGPQSVPIIARDVLFGNPERASLRVSPDGRFLSYLAPLDGVLNVWVAPVDDVAAARAVTHDTTRGVRQYFWAFTSDDIIFLQDLEGDENWQVHVVNLPTGDERNLTPIEEILGPDGEAIMLPGGKPLRPTARIQQVSPNFPGEILIGLNNRNPQLHDIYRVDLATGAMELVEMNNEFLGFVSDDDFTLRIAIKMTPDGGMAMYAPDADGRWAKTMTVPAADVLTTTPLGFDATGRTMYMIDSRGRDTAALVAVDLDTGEQTVLAADPRADIVGGMQHPTKRTMQTAVSSYVRQDIQILDPSIRPDLEYLAKVSDGDPQVTSRTRDDSLWTVAFVDDDGPVRYYLYDRVRRHARFLFTNRPALEDLPLAPMHGRVITSRDGLELVSYLTLPLWTDEDGDGVPSEPLPTVLFVHGGPWARDSWGYNSMHQWLANRGYAVLSVNYRGSTGFGKGFINAANREWGGKMHDDLIDAVDWMIAEGIADADRVAIMGGSYGGYATLVGLTFTPDTFACGVDIVGPSNLRTLLETIPPYWKPMMDLWRTRVGDPFTDEGRAFLDSRSPLTFVDRIVKPLVIGQGANDPRVKQSESDQIVRAMKSRGIAVTYVLYPDEGHGFARPENRLSFFAVVDAFLAQQLGGRAEPIGDDFEGSSIQVLEGATEVPGLTEALDR